MKDILQIVKAQLEMGYTLSFIEAELLKEAIDIVLNQAGNSPVIPNGWVMVPVEPTEAMINAYRGALYSGESAVSCIDLYKAMIAAAPQQEA